MASKRRRKLELKASRSIDQKMQVRRDNFNANLWRFGPPVIAVLILLGVIFFAFFYCLLVFNSKLIANKPS